jgi:hypothetical protein
MRKQYWQSLSKWKWSVKVGLWTNQSRLEMGDPPKTYRLRVFVDIDPVPPFVVAVYRTSKIEKYWR